MKFQRNSSIQTVAMHIATHQRTSEDMASILLDNAKISFHNFSTRFEDYITYKQLRATQELMFSGIGPSILFLARFLSQQNTT